MIMQITDDLLTLSKILNDNNISFYIVGGAVRDDLLGLNVHDYDIAVVSTPDKLINIFQDFKKDIYQAKLGSIKIYIGESLFELSCTRIEIGKKDDLRYPKQIKFVDDIRLDAERRDFSINAIYYDLNKGYIDPLNGINDLNNKIIRFIGDANIRIIEDPLRILRAIRFSLLLGFNITEDGIKAINDHMLLLNKIGILKYDELYKILENGKNIQKLKEYPLLSSCFELDLDMIINSINPLHSFLLNIKTDIFNNIHIDKTLRKKYKKLRN